MSMRKYSNLKRLAQNIRNTLGTEDTSDTKIIIFFLPIMELEKQGSQLNLKI